MTDFDQHTPILLPRRRFVQGLAVGGVLAALPSVLHATNKTAAAANTGSAPELTGKEIDLVIAESWVNFTGIVRKATTINGSIPAPTLRLTEGDEVTIRVTNKLSVPTSIHWHGIILPFQMDGVPGISFNGIAPGETFVYRFRLQQSGTYWYHSHSAMQELTGMYGALIIEPLKHDDIRHDRDYIVQLSDWTDHDPMHVFSHLKMQSDVYNYAQPTVGDFLRDVKKSSLGEAIDKRSMWNAMRMKPTDLADTSSAVMTYLMNGKAPAANWIAMFNAGESIRLRFINAASSTFYDVRIPGLQMTVIQADGQNIEPVDVHEFRFGPGETYDVLVEPKGDVYTLFAQTMDRTGYARGTLSTEKSLTAPVPELDPIEWLSMTDMMGDMDKMAGTDHSRMHHADMSSMEGMDHSKMNHAGMAMDHSQHSMTNNPLAVPSQIVKHARTEYGPSVDMRIDTPRTNLDDPGVGLRELPRNRGLKVLTLADLRSRAGVILQDGTPMREIELHLTGNMERYSWSIDGLEFGKSTPVHMRHGERIRVILQNDTMMVHPMHLHGMWSDLESDQGELLVRRHTIPVQPAQRISFVTTPHELGRWAWHCHLMFHMDAGMFREVVVT